MLQGINATNHSMKVGEIIKAVAAQQNDAEAVGMDSPADEWHALLCRLGSDGAPNPRRLGRYLTKNAGRITGGLRLLTETDTDAKVGKYRVAPVDDWRG
jgi:hypothetical protein